MDNGKGLQVTLKSDEPTPVVLDCCCCTVHLRHCPRLRTAIASVHTDDRQRWWDPYGLACSVARRQ
jgi:hypothetical protein